MRLIPGLVRDWILVEQALESIAEDSLNKRRLHDILRRFPNGENTTIAIDLYYNLDGLFWILTPEYYGQMVYDHELWLRFETLPFLISEFRGNGILQAASDLFQRQMNQRIKTMISLLA